MINAVKLRVKVKIRAKRMPFPVPASKANKPKRLILLTRDKLLFI